jgi:hypothetical protein
MTQLINGANFTNASVAGLTSAEAKIPTAQGVTSTEVVSHAVSSAVGELDYLFNDGLPTPVSTPIEKATGSITGRLGGLVPTGILSGVQPGPAKAAPKQPPSVTSPGLVTKLRKTLGV